MTLTSRKLNYEFNLQNFIKESLISPDEPEPPKKLDELEESTKFSIKYFAFYKTTKPLAFLGEALKNLIIKEHLYISFPTYNRKILTELYKNELNRFVDEQVLQMKSKEIINDPKANYFLNYLAAIFHFNSYQTTKSFFIKNYLGNDLIVQPILRTRPFEEAYKRNYKCNFYLF